MARDGTLWIAFMGRGLASTRPGEWSIRRFSNDPGNPSSLSDDLVRAIHEDAAGVLWVGTYHGLDRFDPRTGGFVHYRHVASDPHSLSNDNIISLFDFPADSGRVLWVGTFGGGLNRLETGTGQVRRYTTREGLPNNVVYGILGDRRGRLWITTNRGMARLDPPTGDVAVFDVSDGLQGNEFAMGASHEGRGGVMYVGGVEGFSLFHPDSIDESGVTSPTVVTAIRRIDADINPMMPAISLGPGDKYITFEFASLDYTNPPRNQYAYRLLGFDDTWTMAGTRRSATFTNLDAGRYVFEVKGTNSDGVWNERPARVVFEVFPPFWRSWWFIVLAAIAALSLGSLAYRRRLAADVEKARIVGELQSARTLQLGLLPSSDPEFGGFDISGACIPAMEVGGDFFEYLGGEPGNDHLTVALGDVSGKGMNAAMTAVMVIGMLPQGKSLSRSPAEILCGINSKLHRKTDERSFVALLLATFERSGREMRFANAGQSMPIRRRGGELKSLTGAGQRFPLGIVERPLYEDCHVDLKAGDLLVFTSDGATDAQRADGTFFDQAGLEQAILALPPDRTAREMVQRLMGAVQEVHGDRQAHDDTTIVVVKVL
jgi:serine phosphatase RsbU (regulator of sigma subunit)